MAINETNPDSQLHFHGLSCTLTCMERLSRNATACWTASGVSYRNLIVAIVIIIGVTVAGPA